jgi:hypothetical protein
MSDPIDQLVREANERARAAEEASRAHARDVPPRGWDTPQPDPGVTPDLAAIMAVLEAAREMVPEDLSQQLADAMRELLLALRALIDWYIDRLESVTKTRSAAEKPVEDIPIT